MKIGFIGLGIMGSRMAANLLKHNFEVIVHNRTKYRADSLLKSGAVWADSPELLAKQVDLLFTMLSTPEVVADTALGTHGFLAAMKTGSLWVDCSTVNPSFSRKMADAAAAHGIRFIDAPVAGSKAAAEQATLIFLVGGRNEDVAALEPCFSAMGKKTIHVGDNGKGTSLKMIFNMIIGTSLASFTEAVVLGQALGLSRELIFESLRGTHVISPFLAAKSEGIEKGEYAPEFPLQWMHKDLHLIALSAFEAGVAIPVENAAKELFSMAKQQGLGEKDLSAIYEFVASQLKR